MLSGEKLGRYEIREKIGSGGMGEVFLAHDGQLDRNIALKVLLPEFCCDDERVQRFKLEAKTVSSINHPGIITIHEIGEENERLFIATEYIDGETLREKIERGDLDLLQSLRIAEQIADALAVAHASGIVHRDIKPENIMIRRDGYAKILDFGLAKPRWLSKSVGAEDATIQLVKTQPGMVMGSVRYMSPEQARGKETDERTDIWSLGVCLYEMLTGTNPFEGDTVSDSLAAVIHVEPAKIETAPEELQEILHKALQKKSSDRYDSIKDFASDLDDLRDEIEHDSTNRRMNSHNSTKAVGVHHTGENKTLIHQTFTAESVTASDQNKTQIYSGASVPPKKRNYFPLFAIVCAILLAVGAWFVLPKILGNPPKFQAVQVSRVTDSGRARLASVSPDGKLVAFVNSQEGQQSLSLRQIATGSSVEIVPPTNFGFYQPTFTPDGDYVFYVANDRSIGTAYQVSALGGQSKKILTDIDSPVTFSPDGKRFAFIRHNPNEGGDTIFIVNADGTLLTPFIQTKDVGYDKFSDLAWSPDGRRFLVGAFKGTVESARKVQIALIEIGDKNFSTIGETVWQKAGGFQWLADGESFVFVGMPNIGETMQIRQMSVHGEIIKQITNDTNDYVSLSISNDGGEMVTTKVETISSFWSFAPATKELKQVVNESKNLLGYAGLSQLSNGRILFSKMTDKEINIFSVNENGGDEKQLTRGSGFNMQPVTTPDGKYILFVSNRNSSEGIWRMNADGTNPVQITSNDAGMDGQMQISPDGKTVFFNRSRNDGGKSAIMQVSIDGGETTVVMNESEVGMMFPRLSRDGKKLAFHRFIYDSKSGAFDTAVRIVGLTNNKVDEKANKIEIGLHPDFCWSPDGKSLTFINRNGVDNIWNLSVETKKETPLTEFTSGNITNMAWSNDGKRVFIARSIVNSDLILIKDNGKT